MEVMVHIGDHGAQGPADGAHPDITQAMDALPFPPGLQAQALLQAQEAHAAATVVATVVSVDSPGADNGGQGTDQRGPIRVIIIGIRRPNTI